MSPPEVPSPSISRVLVVDDYPDAAESLAMILRLWGYEVQAAYHGDAALQAAATFRPQAVVLDLALGKGPDGYEVARRLRQQTADVLLVALSGYAGDADRRRCSEAGFDHFFTKPCCLVELRQVLGMVATGRSRHGQSAGSPPQLSCGTGTAGASDPHA